MSKVYSIEVLILAPVPTGLTQFSIFFIPVAVMCKFKHPNIIKLFGVVSHMDLAYIVMELAPHGQVSWIDGACITVDSTGVSHIFQLYGVDSTLHGQISGIDSLGGVVSHLFLVLM